LHERNLDVLVEPLRVRLDAFVQVHPALSDLRSDPLPFGFSLGLDGIIGRIRYRSSSFRRWVEYTNLGRRIVRRTDDLGRTLLGLLVVSDLFVELSLLELIRSYLSVSSSLGC
jgi:hypothetical protein